MILQERRCKHCGKIFTPKLKTQVYCSQYCRYQENYKNHKHAYVYVCANCGATLYRGKKIAGKHAFCNQQCLSEYSRKQHYEDRQCEMCKKTFTCSKLSKQRFCCPSCQVEWQKKYPVHGENHPSYNHNITIQDRTLICQWCGKKYLVKKPYVRLTSKFCSRECKHNAMIDAARNNKTWEERVDTAPQRIVNQLLQQLQIQYINEYPCGYFSIDNYCEQFHLPIEVMGTYWHADRRKYSILVSDVQKRDIIQDKRKHTFVLNHLHAQILYLWEQDLYDNPELCKQLILLYIHNNGLLLNYHSYNYHLINNTISLNDTLLEGYMDTKNDYHSLINNH